MVSCLMGDSTALASAIVRCCLKISDGFLGVLSLICFILAIAFFVLFVMADKPNYKGTIIAFEGLWQTLSLLFMYCPIAILSLNITLRF